MVHRLCSLIADVLAEDSDAGGFSWGVLLGPLALRRRPVILDAQGGAGRDFAWQKQLVPWTGKGSRLSFGGKQLLLVSS